MVIGQFVDDGEPDDESLCAVGLVGRSWYPRTRDALFRAVVIEPKDSRSLAECVERIRGLQRLLDANPPLGRCIKELLLERVSREWFEGSFEHLQVGCILVEQLPRLPLVNDLSIAGVEEPHMVLHWTALPIQVQTAFYNVTLNSGFHRLYLADIKDIDLRPFMHGNSVKNLLLDGLTPPVPTSGGAFNTIRLGSPTNEFDAVAALRQSEKRATSTPYNLDYLYISDCGQVLHNFVAGPTEWESPQTALCTKKLGVSSVPWDDAMEAAFSLILDSSTDCLERYAVEQDLFEDIADERNTRGAPSLFAFHRIPNMRSLDITIVPNDPPLHPDFNPFPLVLSALDRTSNFGTASQLEEIEFHFDFSRGSPREEENETFDKSRDARELHLAVSQMVDYWAQLDEILSRLAFSQLREVKFAFDFTSFHVYDDCWSTTEDTISGKMKELHKRGMVTVRKSVSSLFSVCEHRIDIEISRFKY